MSSRHRNRPSSLPSTLLAASPPRRASLQDSVPDPVEADENEAEPASEAETEIVEDEDGEAYNNQEPVKSRTISASQYERGRRGAQQKDRSSTISSNSISPKSIPTNLRTPSRYPVSLFSSTRHSSPTSRIYQPPTHHHQYHQKPVRTPVTSSRTDYAPALFVANLPGNHDDHTLMSALAHHFGRFGRVASVKVRREFDVRKTGRGEVWGWVWMEDEATALRAMDAAPEDILFLGDRRIRVERARAHRSLHVRAVPPSVLVSDVSEDCDEEDRKTRWLVKTTNKGEGGEEVKSKDLKSLLEEFGKIEEVALKIGGWNGDDERALEVRFAHRDDSISALNGLRGNHPEIEVTWSHDAKNRFPTSNRPLPATSFSPPYPIHNKSNNPFQTSANNASRPSGYRGGRGGYRGSSSFVPASGRGRGGSGFGGRGGNHSRRDAASSSSGSGRADEGASRDQTGTVDWEEVEETRTKGEEAGTERLRVEEWPALPGVKTPTRLDWDKQVSEPLAASSIITTPSEIIAKAETINKKIDALVPDIIVRPTPKSHTTPPGRQASLAEPTPPSSSSHLVAPDGPPPFYNRPSYHIKPLQKFSSLPLALPSDTNEETSDASNLLATPPARADLHHRTSTPPPVAAAGPSAYQTPVAMSNRSNNLATQNFNLTPSLSLGSGSPSSPMISTPLSGGIGLGIPGMLPSKMAGVGMMIGGGDGGWTDEVEKLIDPSAIFVGGLNKIEMDDIRLREMFEVYGKIVDFQFIPNAPKSQTAFAFISYSTNAEAAAAVASENGTVLAGNRIRVQLREITSVHQRTRIQTASSPLGRLVPRDASDASRTSERPLTRSNVAESRHHVQHPLGSKIQSILPRPVPVLIPVGPRNGPIFPGLPPQQYHQQQQMQISFGGFDGSSGFAFSPYAYHPGAGPGGDGSSFTNANQQPQQHPGMGMGMRPDGLPFGQMFYPPWIYGVPPQFHFQGQMNQYLHHPPPPSFQPSSTNENASHQQLQPSSSDAPSTATSQHIPTGPRSLLEMQRLHQQPQQQQPQIYSAIEQDADEPKSPMTMANEREVAQRIRELQAGQARIHPHPHSSPITHPPPPPTSSDNYRSYHNQQPHHHHIQPSASAVEQQPQPSLTAQQQQPKSLGHTFSSVIDPVVQPPPTSPSLHQEHHTPVPSQFHYPYYSQLQTTPHQQQKHVVPPGSSSVFSSPLDPAVGSFYPHGARGERGEGVGAIGVGTGGGGKQQ